MKPRDYVAHIDFDQNQMVVATMGSEQCTIGLFDVSIPVDLQERQLRVQISIPARNMDTFALRWLAFRTAHLRQYLESSETGEAE